MQQIYKWIDLSVLCIYSYIKIRNIIFVYRVIQYSYNNNKTFL